MTIQSYARQLSTHAGSELELCVSTSAPYFRAEFYHPVKLALDTRRVPRHRAPPRMVCSWRAGY